MALAVVNYPTLSDDDYEWIQSVRREHDGLYVDVIDPHFPFVFPTGNVPEATLIDHVQRHARAPPTSRSCFGARSSAIQTSGTTPTPF